MEQIRTNPNQFTPSQIAETTRDLVGNEVASSFKTLLKEQQSTGKAYEPVRTANAEVSVAHNFLEDQLRSEAGLDVVDGKLIPNSSSKIRTSAEVNKLQNIFDLYKPDFQKGTINADKLLNLRQDLSEVAYNDIGKKSTTVARITDNIRHNLNNTYRGEIPGLKELDLKFSKQEEEIKDLRKGLFDKNGKLNDTAINLIANAGNKGNEARLARLERLVPGITEKLKVLKAIEDIKASMGTKVGRYGAPVAEYGAIAGGLATGHLGAIATGVAAMIITDPLNAVQILRRFGGPETGIGHMVMARLARYATITGDLNATTQGTSGGQTEDQTQNLEQGTSPQQDGSQLPASEVSQSQSTSQSLESLAKANNFDLQGALDAGYTEKEIRDYLIQ
jgi:hypothetical protein